MSNDQIQSICDALEGAWAPYTKGPTGLPVWLKRQVVDSYRNMSQFIPEKEAFNKTLSSTTISAKTLHKWLSGRIVSTAGSSGPRGKYKKKEPKVPAIEKPVKTDAITVSIGGSKVSGSVDAIAQLLKRMQ